MSSPELFISVIVPVFNESLHIEETLDRLLAQRYDPARFEILVIDGRSTDDTREKVSRYVEKHSNVRLLDNPKRLSSAARNIGVRESQGDVVLLVDGHCIIDSDEMLSNVNRAFHYTEPGLGSIDCLGRPQPLELAHANQTQLAIATARRSPLGHHPDSFIYAGKACISPAISVAVAYRKSVFDKVGFFDERFDAAEDCELNYRIDKAKLKCYFTPDIAVRYVPRATLAGLTKQLIRYGKGRVRLARKHPETFSWKSNIPAAFVAGLICGLLLCIAWMICAIFAMQAQPWNFLLSAGCCIFLAVVALYVVMVFAESLRIACKTKNFSYIYFLPMVFATIHFASGRGTLKEFLFPGVKIKSEAEDQRPEA